MSVRVKRKTHTQLKKKDNTVRTVRGRYILKKRWRGEEITAGLKKPNIVFRSGLEQVVDFALSSQEGHSKAEIPDDESTVNRFYHSVTYAYKFIDKGSKETSRLNV